MLVISSKEFRDNQRSYFDKADDGTEVIVQRGKNKAYRITPVHEDDSLMTKEEFFAKIDEAMREYERGECEELTPELRKELFGKL
jgi:hypothetical protein